MKYAQIAKGKRAEKEIFVPVLGREAPERALVRPLTALEDTDVVSRAAEFAKKKGVPAVDGNAVYDSAIWAETLLLTTLDPDSPANAREPFFASITQILDDFDTDTIAILYEHQALWQEECSPLERAKTMADLFEITKGLASAGDTATRFFVGLSPRTRLLWALTTARLIASSPELRSLFSGASESSTESSSRH